MKERRKAGERDEDGPPRQKAITGGVLSCVAGYLRRAKSQRLEERRKARSDRAPAGAEVPPKRSSR